MKLDYQPYYSAPRATRSQSIIAESLTKAQHLESRDKAKEAGKILICFVIGGLFGLAFGMSF